MSDSRRQPELAGHGDPAGSTRDGNGGRATGAVLDVHPDGGAWSPAEGIQDRPVAEPTMDVHRGHPVGDRVGRAQRRQ